MTLLDRLLGRATPNARKAVYGGPALVAYQNGIPMSAMGLDWQARANAYLAAYRVGWFYKAGSRISRDFANLEWTLSYEDTEGDNADEITAPPSNVPWEQLDPLEQFLRLAERPNPYESGRAFRQRQQIRLDFTGRALIYLENADGGGLPTAMYGVSPDRMWQSRNAQGQLIGWVLDKDRPGGGVPFEADEILTIEYPSGTDDPIGVVEAVYSQVRVTSALPQHISDVLATGGRLAGAMWPKDRALDEDEFADAQRAWRNVASDPNAARRLLLFPEPMEFAAGAATPSEIGIPELSTLTRDEIITAFPIHPFLLGVPLASGLNSGDSLRYVLHEYWQGAQHPRAEVWEDAFQQALLPRYEAAVGRPLDFDIEEPNLDDAPAIIEKVGALRGLVAVGFDPKEAVAYVGLDGVKWNGMPMSMDPNAMPMTPTDQLPGQAPGQPNAEGMTVTAGDTNRRDQAMTQQQVIKAKITRDEVIGPEFPGLQAHVRAFLDDQRDRIISKIEATFPPTKAERAKALPDWWDPEEERLLLLDRLRDAYLALNRGALTVVASNTGRIIPGKSVDRILADLLDRAGVRIADINETTRKTIADTLAEGVRRGYSIPQLTKGVPAEGYGGVQGALMANGVNVWDDLRAETIARTETMLAYNQSALLGYGEVNVREVLAMDGDHDAQCAERNGNTYSVDDAMNISDHPNGTLDWVPVT